MNLTNKLFKDEKLNIIVGDYFIKKSGFPSRTTLAKLFLLDFNEEQKKYIDDKSSFAKISQAYLDLGIGNRSHMLYKIEELYRCSKHEVITYADFLISDAINSIISFDYDINFEEIYKDEIFKLTNDKISSLENKKPLYKIFGDLSDGNKMIITSQDIRKYTLLPTYKEYLNLIRKEFCNEKTLILGSDFENTDLIDFLDFLFKTCKKEELKPIYYLSSQSTFGKKSSEFIEKYSIEIIDLKDEKKFIESLKKPITVLNNDEDNKTLNFVKKIETNNEIFKETLKESKNNPIIVEKINKEIKKETLIITDKTPNIYIKTATELKFNSLQLEKNPIKFTNIPLNQEELNIKKINTSKIKIGEETIIGVRLRIIKNGKLKFLEIKNREFKIKFSVSSNNIGVFNNIGDYLEYEIFNTLSPIRFKSIINLFLDIFMGKVLSFKEKEKKNTITLKNEIHYLKFQIVKETEKIYTETFEKLGVPNDNKFYTSSLNYYLIYLLSKYSKKENYESWINMYIDEKTDFDKINKIIIIRKHKLDIKNFSGILIETIEIIDEIKKENLVKHNGKYLFKQNKVKISLEKVEIK